MLRNGEPGVDTCMLAIILLGHLFNRSDDNTVLGTEVSVKYEKLWKSPVGNGIGG